MKLLSTLIKIRNDQTFFRFEKKNKIKKITFYVCIYLFLFQNIFSCQIKISKYKQIFIHLSIYLFIYL